MIDIGKQLLQAGILKSMSINKRRLCSCLGWELWRVLINSLFTGPREGVINIEHGGPTMLSKTHGCFKDFILPEFYETLRLNALANLGIDLRYRLETNVCFGIMTLVYHPNMRVSVYDIPGVT